MPVRQYSRYLSDLKNNLHIFRTSLALMMGHASRAMTLYTYGDANADALAFASVKLKDKLNDNTAYFKFEEEQAATEEE